MCSRPSIAPPDKVCQNWNRSCSTEEIEIGKSTEGKYIWQIGRSQGSFAMASGKSSVLTQAIHTLFEVGTVGGMTDGQLLEQFAARKTEAAFAALVARHGPMVLSVCVGLLGDAHDAEDAFQATFLILAKKSSLIRDPNLLGNWLYGVARRTAQKAKARRARWQGCAGVEGPMSSVAVVNGLVELEPVHREETAALHEEVDRLPQNLRAPIVLCYFEGLTHNEAARRLRWPIGTVRSRMARARDLLRARLIRRGLAYAAIAAAIESPRAVMAEVPHALANATARSAIALATGTVSGLVSTPVGTLMEEVLSTMFMTQLKRVVATALAAACIAAGAGLIAVAALQPQPSSGHGGANAATGKPVKEPEKPTTKKITQDMNPANTMPITGRIVDLEGRPVAAATVQVMQIMKSTGDNLNPWIEAVKRGDPPWIAYNHLHYELPIAPDEKRPTATTDTQGRFGFNGLAAESLVEVVIHGPTIAYTPLKIVTRRIEPIPARGFMSQHGPGFQTVYGPDLTFIAAPGRLVEGLVRDAKTNQLMAGVGIQSESFAGAQSAGITDLKTTTDAQGRFRLIGFPKGSGNKLLIVPNDDQPYFMQEVSVPNPPGIAPVQVVINLNKGIWIQGKVIEHETGTPVPGSWLHYIPFLENAFAQARPEFKKERGVDGTSYQERYQTKEDGTYRLVGLPGRAIVGVVARSQKPYLRGAGFDSIFGVDHKGIPPTYFNPVYISRFFPNSMKEISPSDGAEFVHLDLELYPGTKVRLRIVDPEGKPVAGVTAAGRIGRGQYDREPIKGAELDVVTLAPGEDRMVLVRHVEQKLGKVVQVREGQDKDGPVTVTLEPLARIRGTVVDANGKPVSGAIVRSDPWPHTSGGFNLSLGQIASGHAGEFVMPDVPAGCDYNLAFQQSSTVEAANQTIFREAKVRPGESTDMGVVRFEELRPKPPDPTHVEDCP
jgi:RNA polymerase sigma factor (sigma-70 family)